MHKLQGWLLMKSWQFAQDDNRDAGYWGTSRMLLEAGLCLMEEAEGLDVSSSGRPRRLPGTCVGGVLTPAAACGEALIERLRAAGMRFEIQEDGTAGQIGQRAHAAALSAYADCAGWLRSPAWRCQLQAPTEQRLAETGAPPRLALRPVASTAVPDYMD